MMQIVVRQTIIFHDNDNTNSSRTIKDDSCKLGVDSLSHIFLCKWKRCQFQEKHFTQDRAVSTYPFIDLIIV